MADDRIDLDEWTVWITRAVEDETDRDVSGYRHVRSAIAAALREAHEAGLRERIAVLDCDACGERHMTERGAAMVAENRELRRELAARRAVDGWLGESNSRYLEVGMLSGLFNAVERHRDVDGIVAAGATYPALAAALGLEVEDE